MRKFDSMVLLYGFKHNNAYKCNYSKFTKEYGIIICLHIDDVLIIGTNMHGIDETKNIYILSLK